MAVPPSKCATTEGDFTFAAWMTLVMDTSMLTMESQQVIALRFLRLTLGGSAAPREANRMVAEKVMAIAETAAKVATGSTASSFEQVIFYSRLAGRSDAFQNFRPARSIPDQTLLAIDRC